MKMNENVNLKISKSYNRFLRPWFVRSCRRPTWTATWRRSPCCSPSRCRDLQEDLKFEVKFFIILNILIIEMKMVKGVGVGVKFRPTTCYNFLLHNGPLPIILEISFFTNTSIDYLSYFDSKACIDVPSFIRKKVN